MRNNVNSIWTEEVTDTLKKLWADGFTCSQIAAEMGNGITRNAVIGKVHRLGLEGRSSANGYLRQVSPLPPGATRRSVFREHKPRTFKEKAPPKIITAVSPRTGAFINFKRPPLKHELTKNEMRAMLTLAVQNTAAMEVIQ